MRLGEAIREPPTSEWVEPVDLVEDEHDRQVVAADLGQDGVDGGDLLAQPVLRERGVDDVEDQVGDERLLERRGEALHELGRQPPDEADRVGHEVALAVVLEAARRRVERLEETVLDRHLGAGERVQQRRLADVRVPGERDRRHLRALALLAPHAALGPERLEPGPQLRDAAPGHAAVALELGLARAARADAAAEPLEVLPHAAHPRQVVLELGELDLELALGADGVLGEDVEDQLGAVDDPRRERVLERALLGRVELVVDDQHVGAAVGVERLQLLELALADVGLLVGAVALLHERLHRLDERGARQLAQLAELVLGVGSFREHGEQEPLLGLEPCRGFGSAGDAESMPVRSPRDTSGAAPCRADARARRHPVGEPARGRGARAPALARPAAFAPEYAAEDAFVFARPRRPGVPLVAARRPLRHRAGAGQPARAGSRTAPSTAAARPT